MAGGAAAGGINLGYISGVFVWARSAFFLPIANEFQWNATTTSLALAIPAISGFFLPALTGFLIVRYGVRKVLFAGVMLIGIGLILTAYSFSFESFVKAPIFLVKFTPSLPTHFSPFEPCKNPT